MISILSTLSFLLMLYIVTLYYMRKRKFRSLDNIPGPKSYPVVGSVFEFGYNTVDTLKYLVQYTDQFKNKPFFKMWLGPWHFYLVTADPQVMKYILSSSEHIGKPADYDIFKPWMKNGLFTSNGMNLIKIIGEPCDELPTSDFDEILHKYPTTDDNSFTPIRSHPTKSDEVMLDTSFSGAGDYWRNHRKLINPAFHMELLGGYVRTFNSATNTLIKILSKHVDKGDFDVHPYISNYGLDVILESSTELFLKVQTTADNIFAKYLKTGMSIVIGRFFSVWKKSDILFQFSRDYKALQKIVEYGENQIKQGINKRREKLLNNNNNNENEFGTATDDVGIRKKQILVDTLLRGTIDGKPLTDEEILGQINTIVTAGSDTTSALITFVLYELSKNPEIQNKVFLEVKGIFSNDKNYEPKLQDLNEMKYTELVLKETLRLYPPAPYIARQLGVDVNYNGIIIPKDTAILLLIYGMHRREDLFPHASKFDPDRFLPQNTIPPFSYVPFSAGPRKCIAPKFGMLQAVCTLAKIVMNFEILPASKPDIELAGAVTLTSPNGVHIRVHRRQTGNNT